MLPHNGASRHPAKNLSTPIFPPGRKWPNGFVDFNGIYQQTRKKNHILHTPPAFAFDRKCLRDAERAGAHSIRIVREDTGAVYTATLDDVWRYGFDISKRGYGNQIALHLDRWSVNDAPPVAAFESNQAIKEAQLSLFGGAL